MVEKRVSMHSDQWQQGRNGKITGYSRDSPENERSRSQAALVTSEVGGLGDTVKSPYKTYHVLPLLLFIPSSFCPLFKRRFLEFLIW